MITVTIALFSSALRPLFAEEQEQTQHYDSVGFECAEEALNVLPLLGRGSEFPQFLLSDIETELKRQAPTSSLVKATCSAPPEVLASTLASENNQPEDGANVLSKLRVEFYLDLIVNTGQSVVPLTIEQVYFVENLESIDNRKVTQRFVVLSQATSEPESH